MRTIKFRAWDSISNKMYYWDIIKNSPLGNFIKLEHYTLEQYTGIQDINGKEIAEGDIVYEIFKGNYSYVDTYKKEKLVSLVKEDLVNPCMVLHRQNSRFDSDYEYDFIKCDLLLLEVIGNIHENKDIL